MTPNSVSESPVRVAWSISNGPCRRWVGHFRSGPAGPRRALHPAHPCAPLRTPAHPCAPLAGGPRPPPLMEVAPADGMSPRRRTSAMEDSCHDRHFPRRKFSTADICHGRHLPRWGDRGETPAHSCAAAPCSVPRIPVLGRPHGLGCDRGDSVAGMSTTAGESMRQSNRSRTLFLA